MRLASGGCRSGAVAHVASRSCRFPTCPARVSFSAPARLAELVDASDLKSELPKGRCRFESGSGHHISLLLLAYRGEEDVVGFMLVTETRIDPSSGLMPPALATLFSYWSGKRGSEIMPPRSAFDPTELRSNAGRMHWLVVEGPDVFRYRVYGSRVTNPDAADMTGRTTQDYRDQAFGDLVTRHLGECVRERAAICYDIRAQLDGAPYEYIRIALPFTENGADVSHILVGTLRGTVPKQVMRGMPGQTAG
jgi:PAS domain-containing protein